MTRSAKTINTRGYLPVAIIGLLVLLAVLLMRPGGIGGTGIGGGDGEGNGGIGGTGIGTGFVGRIDGFGSIWVNGSEIFYDADIPVKFNGRMGTPSELKIGHVVQLIARPDNEGVLHATSLGVRYEVIGQVQTLSQNTATIFTDTVIFPMDGTVKPALGDMVAVSGFRRSDGIIMASRIDITDDGQPSKAVELLQPFAAQVKTLSLSGYVRPETDGYSLYGYQIETLPETVLPDGFLTITGVASANRLRDVTVKQAITPTLPPRPELELEPEPIPQDQRAPVPAPQQQQKSPNKTSPIKPQPIREDIPEIEKPVRPDILVAPIPRPEGQRPDTQPVVRPSDEPQNQLPIPVPQQRENDDMRVPDEEPIEEVSNTEVLDQSPDEPDLAEPDIIEQREETPEEVTGEMDAPERDVVTPERDTRPETPTRPERTDRPERPERVERPVRPDRPERPERPERPDRPR